MHNSIISRRAAIQQSIANQFSGGAAPRFYNSDSIQQYSNDLKKSLDSKNITQVEYDLGMKKVSDLKQTEINGVTIFVEA